MARIPVSRIARRVQKEARALVREARQGLRRYEDRLSTGVRDRVRLGADNLEKACRESDHEAIRRELASLDELVDEHLAFGRKSTTREYAESIGAAVLIALMLRGFVVEAFKIPSGSMIPTMEIGDHIFVNKLLYGVRVPFTETKVMTWRTPRAGEVVVFRYPCEEKDFIKRIVAVAGDVVEVRCDMLYVNGVAVPEALASADARYHDNGTSLADRCYAVGRSGWSECSASDYVSRQNGTEYHTYFDTSRPEREARAKAVDRPTDYWSYVPGRGVGVHRSAFDFPALDNDEPMSTADALLPDGEASEPPGAERLAAMRRVLEGETAEAVAKDLSRRHRGRAWCTLDDCITAHDIEGWFPIATECVPNVPRPADFRARLVPAPAERAGEACGPKLGFKIPDGHVWAMGDNREKSADSREWGPVPLSSVKGKALFIWWASQPADAGGIQWDRMGKIVR